MVWVTLSATSSNGSDPGNAMGYYVVAALTALCAVWFIRTSVRQWHGKGRPLSYWLRGGVFDAHALAAEIAVYVVAIAGIVVAVALFLSIYHFNRPRFLVPPALRDQPGSREGRRQERAAREG